MSYESTPYPTAEGLPSSDPDSRKPKKEKDKKQRDGADASPAETQQPVAGGKEAAEKTKAARDLARLFEKDVAAPAEKPKEDKPEKPAHEVGEDEPEAPEESAEAADKTLEGDENANELSADERREAAQQLIEARQQEVAKEGQELEPGTVQADANVAAEQFLAGVNEQLAAGAAPEDATAAAFEQATGEQAPEIPGQEALEEAEPLAGDTDEDDTANAGAARTAGTAGGRRGGGTAVPFTAMGPNAGYGAPAGANMAPGAATPTYERSTAGTTVLVAVLAYLWGRHRGRIKTERRLLPAQQKLEREVYALHDHLAIREAQVRQLVWERAETAAKAVAEVAAVAPAAEKPETSVRPVTKAEQVAAPSVKPEADKRTPESVLRKELATKDVLRIAESIIVGAATIRQVFETNLITESGLRSIVAEHLRGGDVHKVLREALTEKEKTYERDPFLARIAEEQQAAAAGDGAQSGGAISPARGEAMDQSQMEAAQSAGAQRNAEFHVSETSEATRPLIIANIIALAVLAGLVLVLAVLWLTR